MNNFVLPASVKVMLCQRARRLHHFIWHSVRNSWHQFPAVVQQQLSANGWAPPRPAFDAAGNLNLQNGSGEDFLFMHREMIAHTNSALQAAADPDYQQVEGWDTVPLPDDADFPVPPVYTIVDGGNVIVDTTDIKSDAFYFQPPEPDGSGGGMQHWDQLLGNPQVLQGLSLARLGSFLEFTIHNWMHMRFSSNPGQPRPDANPQNADTIDPIWDAVTYDWLGDTYSSHTANHFWKLHGLIDRHIDQWAAVNGIQTINWIGTWVGKMPPAPDTGGLELASTGRPNVFAALEALSTSESSTEESAGHHHDHGHGSHHIHEMEAIAKLIQDCGVHYHFYDQNTPPMGFRIAKL
jgi:hypothetical protein